MQVRAINDYIIIMLLDDKSLMISNYEKCLYCHLLGFVDSQANKTDQQGLTPMCVVFQMPLADTE